MSGDNPLADPMGHSIDTDYFHFPGGREWDVFKWSHELLNDGLSFMGVHGLSKFMFLELIAALIVIVLFIPYMLNIRLFGYARGWFANMLESVMFFIKDQVAEPAIGHHDAHKFLPYLWSVFFFILVNNLLGMVPWLGSATASLGTTVALAICSLIAIHGGGVWKMGPIEYAKSIAPHAPLPIYIMLYLIELLGHIIKPTILAFRLFINMVAGHTVLFVLLAFIQMVGPSRSYFIVTPASILGVVLISCLELFVAFLQAYVFTYLSAIFIGAAVHPHH